MNRVLSFILLSALCLLTNYAGAQNITTLAGNGYFSYSGDRGAATTAQLLLPDGIASDASGNMYVADRFNHRVRKINTAGIITTVAGNGTAGYGGDGGAATLAKINNPSGVALDASGNLYIVDQYNYRIRKVSPSGIISTFAGTGSPGYFGDGGAATGAIFNQPVGIAIDGIGNVYIADYQNSAIRKINTSGIVSTFAGRGGAGFAGDGGPSTSSKLDHPTGVSADAAGNIYIADCDNSRVRKVNTSGIISTFAGTGVAAYSGDGAAATLAELNAPYAVKADASGNVYIADNANHRVRKVNTAGVISTFAGIGIEGTSGDAGQASVARLTSPKGIAMDAAGNMLIVDQDNNRIRKVFTSGIITTYAGNDGNGSIATAHAVNPYNAVTDASGNLYLTDADNKRVCMVSKSGILKTIAGYTHTHIIHVHGGGGGVISHSGPATAIEFEYPSGIALDGKGNIYIADLEDNIVDKVNAAGIISTVAGNGSHTYGGDGVTATSTPLNGPAGLTIDKYGNLYIADQANNRVRKVNTAGIISTVAGNGISAYAGDGGAATSASLKKPSAVAVDIDGNLFIADANNNVIRKVDAAGIISTVAGTGARGYSGDGGSATAAELNFPSGVAVDTCHNLYILDASNSRYRKVNALGIITTMAGKGTRAFSGDGGPATAGELSGPTGLTIDDSGNVIIADYDNYRVRKVQSSSLPAIKGNGTICIGGTRTLSNAILGGTWTCSNPAVASIGSSTGTVTGISAGTATIIYDVANNTVITTVTITPLPIAGTITGMGDVCVGSNITLSDTASGGLWSVSNTTASVTAGVVTGLVAGTGTISYVVTTVCGTAAAVKTLTVNPLPDAGAITGLAELCIGTTITLSNAVAGGVWSSGSTCASVVAGVVTGVAAGTATISYAVTNMCGTANALKTVTVYPMPDAGVITGPVAVCTGASIKLTDATPGGVWSTSNTSATVTGGIVSGVAAGLDTVQYSVTNFCGTAVADYAITVNAVPASITGKTSVCTDATTLLSNTTTGGTWSSSNTAIATVSTAGLVSGLGSGVTTIRYMLSTGCLSSFNITVNTAPSGITGPATFCVGSLSVFSNSVAGGSFSSGNTSIATIDAATGTATGVAAGVAGITYTTANGCFVTRNPTVIALPDAGALTGAHELCVGASVVLTSSVTGGTWTTGSAVAAINTTGSVTGLTPGATDIIYTVTNDCGTDTAMYTIAVLACDHTGEALTNRNKGELIVFPNPGKGDLTLMVAGSGRDAVITVTNIIGQKIAQVLVDMNKPAVLSLLADKPAGIYTVTAHTADGDYVAKVVISR